MDHQNADYQAALSEAANAFIKAMALRGFTARDYPQNTVAHMTRQAHLLFEVDPKGAHPLADQAIVQFLQAGKSPTLVPKSAAAPRKNLGFSSLGHRQAA